MKKMTRTMFVPRKRSSVFVLRCAKSVFSKARMFRGGASPNNSILIRFLRINVSLLMHCNERRTDLLAHMLQTQSDQ